MPISRVGDVPWLVLALSLDLHACDFWLWGYFKSKVFVTKTNAVAKLKNYISNQVAVIAVSTTYRVMANIEDLCEGRSMSSERYYIT